jgi:hypothetical protein
MIGFAPEDGLVPENALTATLGHAPFSYARRRYRTLN